MKISRLFWKFLYKYQNKQIILKKYIDNMW